MFPPEDFQGNADQEAVSMAKLTLDDLLRMLTG
jgi:hypothetical protein